MLKSRANAINKTLASIGVIILGVITIIQSDEVIPLIRLITIIALLCLVTSRIIAIFLDHKYQENLFYALIYSVIIALIIIYPNIYVRSISLVVSIYAYVNFLIQAINYYIFRKNHIQGVMFTLFRAILDLCFGLGLTLMPIFASHLIFVFAGVYLIIFGFFNSLSWIYILFNERFSISVSLPAIITTFLPVTLYMKIKNDPKVEEYIKHEPEPSEYPLEISIYTHEDGFEAIGHIDVSYYGTIYSYGLHDPKTRSLFGSAGEGVLVVSDRSKFLKSALKDGKTMIFNFQFDLSDEQLKLVKKRIDLLMEDAIPFKCEAELQLEEGLVTNANDYISGVYLDTNCDLYKFTKGPFKTYFVFSQNCIQLTDFLVRNQQIDLLKMTGIITPGAYLSFLFSLYEKDNSLVKNLVIYK